MHYLPDISEVASELTESYDTGLQVHLPFSDINIASVIPRVRQLGVEFITDSIEAAAGIGIGKATLHPGSASSISFRDRDWVMATARRSMETIYECAVEHGVTICLENMPYRSMIGPDMDELLALSEGFEPEIWSICYDMGHGHISGLEGSIEKHTDRIYNLHVHDNRGKKDSHLIPGQGNIDFDTLSPVLKRSPCEIAVFEAQDLRDALSGKEEVAKYFG